MYRDGSTIKSEFPLLHLDINNSKYMHCKLIFRMTILHDVTVQKIVDFTVTTGRPTKPLSPKLCNTRAWMLSHTVSALRRT